MTRKPMVAAGGGALECAAAKVRRPGAMKREAWDPPGFSGDKGRKLELWQRSVSKGPVRRGGPALVEFPHDSPENP